jgi:hypothetical protein
MFASIIASAVLLIPAEWHIDCSGCNNVAARTTIDIRITTMDGSGFTTGILLGDEPDPATARLLLRLALEDKEYTLAPVGKSILVIQGMKSPIRSIEFESKGWKPAVRWSPLLPKK